MNSLALVHPTAEAPEPSGALQGSQLSASEFASVCKQYLPQIWRQLRAMGVVDGLLDDATQEVFLTAHHKISGFEGRSQLSTWLYGIAYRVGCNYRRKARRHAALELNETEHYCPRADPEQSLSSKQAARIVETFCDSLSEKLRDVFVLCLLEGQSAPEVALILGISENTVYSRVRLVREAFRNQIEKGTG